jgi:polyhydroxybutyrate depolymerase
VRTIVALSVVAATLTCGGRAGASGARGVVPYGAPIRPAVTAVGRVVQGALRTPDGRLRTYRVYVPRSLPAHRPVPLLVAMHGGLGSGAQFERNSGFDGLAESNRFLVVYPDGVQAGRIAGLDVWNAGGCCGAADQAHENVNDVRFISLLITKLEHTFHVDRSRVFATGHSNGAMLGLRLACQLSGKIAGVAVQAGTLFVHRCAPAHPVAVMEIHGTDDQHLPINGGKGPKDISGSVYPPPAQGLKTLAARDHCRHRPATSVDSKNHDLTYEIWRPCRAGTIVEWVKVRGASHAWMGHPASSPAAERLAGKPYMRFDSSAAVWSFLSAHPRR